MTFPIYFKVNEIQVLVYPRPRAQAAFESGAQVISTDYFKPGNAYKTDYFIVLPGAQAARINPVNGVEKKK